MAGRARVNIAADDRQGAVICCTGQVTGLRCEMCLNAPESSSRRHNPNCSGDGTGVLDQRRGKIPAPKRLGQSSAKLGEAHCSHNSTNPPGDEATQCTAAGHAKRGAAKRSAHDSGDNSARCLAARGVRQLVDDQLADRQQGKDEWGREGAEEA